MQNILQIFHRTDLESDDSSCLFYGTHLEHLNHLHSFQTQTEGLPPHFYITLSVFL